MAKKLTIQEVEHIADLARIGLSDEEKSKLQEDLGSILDYIDKFQGLDVSGVEAVANISGLENEMREDENGSTRTSPETLMGMVPETKDGYVKVKQVLNK